MMIVSISISNCALWWSVFCTAVEARFEDPVYTFVENIGSGTIAVTLNRQSSVPIVLQYSTSDGTAVGK